MSLRGILGLYGPNKPHWDNDTYDAIKRAGVSWVLWRTDADPKTPKRLQEMGVNVIAQAPDRFNGNAHLDPGHQAVYDYDVVRETCPPGTSFVPDNEPNLNPLKAGVWHAEQWTRYLRAYMAVWRWLDPSGHFPLITPGLAVGPDRNSALWHFIGRENLRETDGIGLHAYWQLETQIPQPAFGAPWKLLRANTNLTPLYFLEYANTRPDFTHAATLSQYESWLRSLPETTRCALLFGLHLTDDWDRFHITEPVLDWLASLE